MPTWLMTFLFGDPNIQVNLAWVVPTAMMATSLIGSYLDSKKKKKKVPETTVTQEPLMSPQQQEAMDMLLNYSKTGKWGAGGEEYTGALGNYDMSALEQTGQSKLAELMGTGVGGEMFGLGTEELKKILSGTGYDPYDEKGLYKGFKRTALKEGEEAKDTLKRNAAFSGNLYSRDVVNRMGDLGEETQASLQGKLAELYDTYAQRKQQAAGQAITAGQMGEQMSLNRIGASQTVGSLSRTLADLEAKDKYAEWTRSRKEIGDMVSAAGKVAGGVGWGAKSMTLPETYYNEASPWSKVLDTIGNIGGYGLGKYGESAGWFS